MLMLELWGLLLSAAAIGITDASPLAHIHVKFVQLPHIQEHAITTDGGRLISQQSFLSIGKRNGASSRIPKIGSPDGNSEDHDKNFILIDKTHVSPDFSNGLGYPDPLLLTGERAALAVTNIYGHVSETIGRGQCVGNEVKGWLRGWLSPGPRSRRTT